MGQTTPRILVVGIGGIGGTVAAHLANLGADVTALCRNSEICRAVRANGYKLVGDGGSQSAPAEVVSEIKTGDRYDVIFLATQPPSVEEAARSVAPALSENGRIVVFQNGLCETRVARAVGESRVIGAVVAWGATMVEPGVYDRTSSGGFVIGALSGKPDESVKTIAGMLESIGPVECTENLLGARWSKLALNCAISSLGTIGGERLGPLVRVRRYRRLGLEIISEVVRVAKAEGVSLQKVAGTVDLEWLQLPESEKRAGSPSLAAKHGMLMAVGLRYRRLRSSMLAAIEQGKPPSVDFLNGEVVSRGKTCGISVPINAMIVETVHNIAKGRVRSSRELLDEIYERTR